MRAHSCLALAALTAGVMMVTGGCGDDGDDSPGNAVTNDVTAEVEEWEVDSDATGAKAGEVTFTVRNGGTIKHEFLVVKTDLPAGEIPIGPDDHFDEENPDIEVIDEIPEFATDTTETLTVDLAPGTYQLVCNLPEHYGNGMYREFTVES